MIMIREGRAENLLVITAEEHLSKLNPYIPLSSHYDSTRQASN
jgi:hypothetical protein